MLLPCNVISEASYCIYIPNVLYLYAQRAASICPACCIYMPSVLYLYTPHQHPHIQIIE